MDHKWADVFRDWHDDLIWCARHGVPQLVVIRVLAFMLTRLLHIVADYNEDSDRVIELLHEVAQEFYNDPAFHEDAVAEPEVPGIERVTSTEVDYLMLVKVRPGRQYTVARELRRRIKVCFEKNHIKAGGPAQVFV